MLRHSSPSSFFYRQFEGEFNRCLKNPAQLRHVIAFPVVCGEFLNCSSPFCQEEVRGGRVGGRREEGRRERKGGGVGGWERGEMKGGGWEGEKGGEGRRGRADGMEGEREGERRGE